MRALIWFNGPSARKYHSVIPPQPLEIGCNHILRDRSVHHVCCYDWQMKSQIEMREGVEYWCRNGHRDDQWREVTYPMAEQPTQSGTMAVLLARNLGATSIVICGCDWGISTESCYDYGTRTSARKYTNSQSALLRRINQHTPIRLIADSLRDVSLHFTHDWHHVLN